jgi:hypothetical protein
MKDSFVFYSSFHEAIDKLPDDVQLEMYRAICKYSLYGEIPELSPIANAMFILIRPNIDNAQSRYAARVENGKKGGRPPKTPNPTETQQKPNKNLTETKPQPKENLYVNVDVNDDVNVDVDVNENVYVDSFTTTTTMVPPSFAKVHQYFTECLGKGCVDESDKFFCYNEKRNWDCLPEWEKAADLWIARMNEHEKGH